MKNLVGFLYIFKHVSLNALTEVCVIGNSLSERNHLKQFI